MVSDKEPEAQVKRERPRTRHDLEDNLEYDPIDNYENTGPHHREGCIMRRAKRGGFCKALLHRNSGLGRPTCSL